MAPVTSEFNRDEFKIAFTNNGLNIYAVAAADEAIKDSGITFDNENIKLRTGVNVGVMCSDIPKLTDIILEAGK